jgi:hypothetical protein
LRATKEEKVKARKKRITDALKRLLQKSVYPRFLYRKSLMRQGIQKVEFFTISRPRMTYI